MTFQGVKKVIREIHSEPNGGTLSWGRCAATGAFITMAIAILHMTFHTGSMPSLSGAAEFVTAPYLANRVATAVQAFSGNPVTPPTDPTKV
jgi:hypothetical protein